MPMRLASMRERMHALCLVAAQTQHASLVMVERSRQLIRNVFGDGAALVHVAGDPLLIPRHARSGRHC